MKIKNDYLRLCVNYLQKHYPNKTFDQLTPAELNTLIGQTVLEVFCQTWEKAKKAQKKVKKVVYLSMEYLQGRAITTNLINLGLYDQVVAFLEAHGVDPSKFEDIIDQNLGNGGLGRLASCYIQAAATANYGFRGYTLRYKDGFFKQEIFDGRQVDEPDYWLSGKNRDFDPWQVRNEEADVYFKMMGTQYVAKAYDMPIFGYGTKNINTLRMWDVVATGRAAMNGISTVLYPNDQMLRLAQEYALSYASTYDILREYCVDHDDLSGFPEYYTVQLNDTHPILAIPVLFCLLEKEKNLSHAEARKIVEKTFAYTNHTVLAEALEHWENNMIKYVSQDVYDMLYVMNMEVIDEVQAKGKNPWLTQLVQDDVVYMANIAAYYSYSINGVAKIHSDLVKTQVLPQFYELFPKKFTNVTNGIDFGRWLDASNRPLSNFTNELLKKIGVPTSWQEDNSLISELLQFVGDEKVISDFKNVKYAAKVKLAAYMLKRDGLKLNPDSIIITQVKRFHEYKRQLLLLVFAHYLYTSLKNGSISIDSIPKMTIIIGGKAAPGYEFAKATIKFATRLQEIINSDPWVASKFNFFFVKNFNVTYGEKIYKATDVSVQASMAGKEASGTGNMKFMLNGAVTLGTEDGANIEIFDDAGRENNYSFGAEKEEIFSVIANGYVPFEHYMKPQNSHIKATIDYLKNSNRPEFVKIANDTLKFDPYCVIYDYNAFETGMFNVLSDYKERQDEFYKKCFVNYASSAKFSAVRSITEYAENIWNLQKVQIA